MKYKKLIMKTKDKLDEDEIKQLDEYINKYRPSHRIYIKLIAVREVKQGKTRTEVAEYLRVNREVLEIG